MAKATQDNREAGFSVEGMDKDALLLRSFHGSEQLGRLFQFEVELLSSNHSINFDQVIGKNVTIRLNLPGNKKRWFNGHISRFVQTQGVGVYGRYLATVVPWLWFLTRTADCRIFQNKTVPDIVEEVFKGHNLSDFRKPSGQFKQWIYCVQYRETDLNFVSRLMEQEGIYYFFEHEQKKHTMVMTSSASAHKEYPGFEKVSFNPSAHGGYISDWTIQKELQTGVYAHTDYNFTTPKGKMDGSANVSRRYDKADLEVFDYPGEYEQGGEANDYAKIRIEELQAQYETLHGQTDARGICSGYRFQFQDFKERTDQNRKFLVQSANHTIELDYYEADVAPPSDSVYHCAFAALDADTPFKPARITPKPLIQGPQTAVVVGPGGEEIYTDNDGYGQVKVQFHWDRQGKKDDKSSCWIRVSQPWAGEKWGGVFLPRIGQEVIVEFLEGDPDRPIITGRVYNNDQKPPYDLPANKTQSGFKSRSSKGGGAANFNEIRFEDKKGSEELYIHAEKDKTIMVENDESITVGHDKTEKVGHDEQITIANDRTEAVAGNETLAVSKNRSRTVAQNEIVSVALTRTHSVGINEMINVGAAQEVSVGGLRALTVGLQQATTIGLDHTETVGKNHSETIGADHNQNVGKNQGSSVGADRSANVGNNDSLSVGKKLSIEAGEEITITTGKASIHMKKDGTIQISGKDITLEASGEMNITASKNITMKGQKILQN